MEDHGVKEMSEALQGVMEIGLAFVELAKDGLDFSDLPALYAKIQSEPLKSTVAKAADGIKSVPDEIKDIDMAEVMQLAMLIMPYIPRYIEAVKKK